MTDNERFDVVAEVRLIKQRFVDWTAQHDKHTEEWRTGIEKKLDQILNQFDEVPCKRMCQNSDNIKAIWVFISAIILAVIVEFFKR